MREAAREMVETGKYLVPTLDYQPHWTKPPLAYWGIAAGIMLFGQNEWGVRFSNSLSFFITIIITMILGSLLWEYRVGLIAGLIYLSSLFRFLEQTLYLPTRFSLCGSYLQFSVISKHTDQRNRKEKLFG